MGSEQRPKDVSLLPWDDEPLLFGDADAAIDVALDESGLSRFMVGMQPRQCTIRTTDTHPATTLYTPQRPTIDDLLAGVLPKFPKRPPLEYFLRSQQSAISSTHSAGDIGRAGEVNAPEKAQPRIALDDWKDDDFDEKAAMVRIRRSVLRSALNHGAPEDLAVMHSSPARDSSVEAVVGTPKGLARQERGEGRVGHAPRNQRRTIHASSSNGSSPMQADANAYADTVQGAETNQAAGLEDPPPQTGSFRTAASVLQSSGRGSAQHAGQRRGAGGYRARLKRPRSGPVDSHDSENDAAARQITRSVLRRRGGSALHTGSRPGGLYRPPARDNGPDARDAKESTTGANVPEVPNVDPKLVEMIMNEMLSNAADVDWDDIAGLRFAKQCIMEAVVWPMKRPDIFSGLRGPPKGVLLFGPPGTGKTLIGRAIASKSGAKFFNISASSLMSKWVGEGEKLVRALFGVARALQPSVVFIDEIDSLLTQRTETDQESSRRVKTEFLVQMDGAGTSREDRILVIGATNRPSELDEAARRRLVKRLYIPLPDDDARCALVTRLLCGQRHEVTDRALKDLVQLTKGYSGADLYALCAEASLGPVRDLGDQIGSVSVDNVRPISYRDFVDACRAVRASVSDSDLTAYVEWNKTYGSFPASEEDVSKTERS